MNKYLLSASALALLAGSASADTYTVNTTSNADTRDAELSLFEALSVLSDAAGTLSFGDLSGSEQALITTDASGENRIEFNIVGAGPHFIETPNGNDFGSGIGSGYPPITADNVIIDGFSQPGSSANSNAILAPNNADLRITLDSRNFTSGLGENAVFLVFAENFALQGTNFLGNLTQVSPATLYGIFPTDDGSSNKSRAVHLRGNNVGFSPDGLGGNIYAGFSYALLDYISLGDNVVGTNGDNVDDTGANAGAGDRTEFNVFIGNGVSALFEDLPSTSTNTVAGNFFNVMPDGVSDIPTVALNQHAVFGDIIESGVHANLTIGTNSDGVSDENERNIVGVVLDEFYEDYSYGSTFPTNIVIAGNYIGVGIDGTTEINGGINEFIKEPAQPFNNLRIGSDLDGVNDDIEANIIANINTSFLIYINEATPLATAERSVAFRGNSMFDNAPSLGFFVQEEFSRAGIILGSDAITPTLSVDPTGTASGVLPVTSATNGTLVTDVEVDLYVADAGTLPGNPQPADYIMTIVDNGVGDNDPAVGQFEFDTASALNAAGYGGQAIELLVTANILGGDGVATSPWSSPASLTVPAAASVSEWELYQ